MANIVLCKTLQHLPKLGFWFEIHHLATLNFASSFAELSHPCFLKSKKWQEVGQVVDAKK
jgi:hypothetical protein